MEKQSILPGKAAGLHDQTHLRTYMAAVGSLFSAVIRMFPSGFYLWSIHILEHTIH